MDDTPISGRRVRLAFAVTAFVALMPALFVFLQAGPAAVDFLGSPRGTYRGIVLGVKAVALTLVLMVLLSVAMAFGRRVVRRPFRA